MKYILRIFVNFLLICSVNEWYGWNYSNDHLYSYKIFWGMVFPGILILVLLGALNWFLNRFSKSRLSFGWSVLLAMLCTVLYAACQFIRPDMSPYTIIGPEFMYLCICMEILGGLFLSWLVYFTVQRVIRKKSERQ